MTDIAVLIARLRDRAEVWKDNPESQMDMAAADALYAQYQTLQDVRSYAESYDDHVRVELLEIINS